MKKHMRKQLKIMGMLIAMLVLQSKVFAVNNTFHFDLLGPGGIYSVNYERKIMEDVYAKVGASYLKLGDADIWTIPFSISKLLGNEASSHKFELGLGGTLVRGSSSSASLSMAGDNYNINLYRKVEGPTDVFAHGIIGYRYMPLEDDGLVFRLSFIPGYVNKVIVPWVGISLGYAF